ncbi:MAG: hypothetical protein J6M92_16695 [Oribacterium sp.]|nr:hypothetical protein [Oribacterium sp.]
MLSLKIEKEVETRHTVLKGKDWDLRQTVSIFVCVVIVAFFWWAGDLDATGIAIVAVPFGGVAYLVGWKEEAGLRIEDLLLKYLQKSIYKNERRGYHTRNGYVDLMNGAYEKMRSADMADRRAVRAIRRQEKRTKAKRKLSKYKGYE